MSKATSTTGDVSHGHGFDVVAQGRHARMVTAIADCQVLLAQGMGAGAYQSMEQAGIRPVVTDIASRGGVDDHPDRRDGRTEGFAARRRERSANATD